MILNNEVYYFNTMDNISAAKAQNSLPFKLVVTTLVGSRYEGELGSLDELIEKMYNGYKIPYTCLIGLDIRFLLGFTINDNMLMNLLALDSNFNYKINPFDGVYCKIFHDVCTIEQMCEFFTKDLIGGFIPNGDDINSWDKLRRDANANIQEWFDYINIFEPIINKNLVNFYEYLAVLLHRYDITIDNANRHEYNGVRSIETEYGTSFAINYKKRYSTED